MKTMTIAGMAGLLAALVLPMSAKAGGFGHACDQGPHAHGHHGYPHHAAGPMVWPGDALRHRSVRERYSHRNPSPHERAYHHGSGQAAHQPVVVLHTAPARASVRYVAAAPVVLTGPSLHRGGGHGLHAVAMRSHGGPGGPMMMHGHHKKHR
ncbi:MAG: hypothetical protein ACKVP7_18130 [Hyphomicrobiaceae bacterium]